MLNIGPESTPEHQQHQQDGRRHDTVTFLGGLIDVGTLFEIPAGL
ncbi:hypothetical protein OPW41_11685 [Vibrio europaeus]|nr:hypothetical protein [Vibrio europaeus]MDC5721958.1 hypothetical protein [Vibrio europaeus]MDC5758081.1 hypothetical protein [Vibrio europaeus]MDC5776341.1 hypothetical protein [Vibrio europaeus]MDC5795491.1 hypothetical protein [Vibrio europaeus]MDC5798336.1 hypothetical protein [Vibrio europaeus]